MEAFERVGRMELGAVLLGEMELTPPTPSTLQYPVYTIPSAVLDRKVVAMITGTPRLSTRQHQLKDGRTTYPRQAGTLQWLYTST